MNKEGFGVSSCVCNVVQCGKVCLVADIQPSPHKAFSTLLKLTGRMYVTTSISPNSPQSTALTVSCDEFMASPPKGSKPVTKNFIVKLVYIFYAIIVYIDILEVNTIG
jgi:hypothetical protein